MAQSWASKWLVDREWKPWDPFLSWLCRAVPLLMPLSMGYNRHWASVTVYASFPTWVLAFLSFSSHLILLSNLCCFSFHMNSVHTTDLIFHLFFLTWPWLFLGTSISELEDCDGRSLSTLWYFVFSLYKVTMTIFCLILNGSGMKASPALGCS